MDAVLARRSSARDVETDAEGARKVLEGATGRCTKGVSAAHARRVVSVEAALVEPDPLKGNFDDEPGFVLQSIGNESGSIPKVPRRRENRTSIHLRIFVTGWKIRSETSARGRQVCQRAMTCAQTCTKRCDESSHVVPFGCAANALAQYQRILVWSSSVSSRRWWHGPR